MNSIQVSVWIIPGFKWSKYVRLGLANAVTVDSGWTENH